LPGYDPKNKKNVEWTSWNPESAIKISWRSFGTPFRVAPHPNLGSEEYINVKKEELGRLLPIVADWYEKLPDNKKYLLAAVVLVISLISGCICTPSQNPNQGPQSQDPGKLTRPDINPQGSQGGKPGGSGQVAKPDDPARESCQNKCGEKCTKKVNDCVEDCKLKYESVCEEASKAFAGCNIACMHVPMSPSPGPSPRLDCFKACQLIFKDSCNSQGLTGCTQICPGQYQTCEKDCIKDC